MSERTIFVIMKYEWSRKIQVLKFSSFLVLESRRTFPGIPQPSRLLDCILLRNEHSVLHLRFQSQCIFPVRRLYLCNIKLGGCDTDYFIFLSKEAWLACIFLWHEYALWLQRDSNLNPNQRSHPRFCEVCHKSLRKGIFQLCKPLIITYQLHMSCTRYWWNRKKTNGELWCSPLHVIPKQDHCRCFLGPSSIVQDLTLSFSLCRHPCWNWR